MDYRGAGSFPISHCITHMVRARERVPPPATAAASERTRVLFLSFRKTGRRMGIQYHQSQKREKEEGEN